VVETRAALREYCCAMRRATLAVLMTLASACISPAWAWGPQGHRTVGAIADALLTPAARAAVAQLLAEDLDKFDRPSGRTTLGAVSVWADEIRGTPAAHPAWHYDDMPVCGRSPKERYCPAGQCNTEQLKRLIPLLADTRAAPRERNEALKWVVHLLGDIHQPLHAADNSDHGGNDVQVALAGVRTRGRENLHRAWDNDLVRLALHAPDRQRPPADVAALASEARRLADATGQGSPDSWALESNRLAREVAYTYPGFACNQVPRRIVVLDAPYQARATVVVRERLLLAGARLATVLNTALVSSGGGARRCAASWAQTLISQALSSGFLGRLPPTVSVALGLAKADQGTEVRQLLRKSGHQVRTFNVSVANHGDVVIFNVNGRTGATVAYLLTPDGQLRKAAAYQAGGEAHELPAAEAKAGLAREVRFWSARARQSEPPAQP
jgi:S1/P1 Nuclease